MSEVVCKLKHESDQRALKLMMDVIDVRLEAMDKALILQSGEVSRRLEELNHIKAERLLDRQSFLQRNIYDIKTDYYDKWIVSMEKRLTIQETRSILWTSLIGGAVVVLQVLLHWWK